MQREGPPGWSGFESMFIDWKPHPPIPDWLSDVIPGWVGVFAFYELESLRQSSWWPIQSGMQEARKKLWGQAMLLLSPALSDRFKSLLGRKPPEKGASFSECLLELLSVPGKRQLSQHKNRGEIPHSQFCLLTPLLISQTMKEVWYQELWACPCSTTVDFVIRQAGFESMFIDWKPPPPIPDWLSNVLPSLIEKLHALGKESSQLNLAAVDQLFLRMSECLQQDGIR